MPETAKLQAIFSCPSGIQKPATRSSRDFAGILDYDDYRNFEAVVEKAKKACFNSGHRIEDHFVDVTEMIEIGKGSKREIKVTLLSRYACYLVIQNIDPNKESLGA